MNDMPKIHIYISKWNAHFFSFIWLHDTTCNSKKKSQVYNVYKSQRQKCCLVEKISLRGCGKKN